MSNITAFIIETGEPSFNQCLMRVKAQTIPSKIKIISNTYPMNAAFQRMLDECDTEYYVQVDADMLLEPDCFEKLLEGIQQSTTHFEYCGWLWDDDVNRPIQGVKIYRHAYCSKHDYEDSLSCEVAHFEGMKRLGYTLSIGDLPRSREDCLGLHYASQNPKMAFARWERCMIKMRKLSGMGWLAEYPKIFLEEFIKDPTDEIKKARVFGVMSGLSCDIEDGMEADASKENQNYRRFSALMGEYSHGPSDLVLYLTDKCNFKCVFDGNPCLRETEEGTPSSGDMTPEMLDDILKKHPTIKGCCIAGYGEPLLHKQLGVLLDVLHKNGVFANIITNGALLPTKYEVCKHPAIYQVSVSLNAVNAEDHQEFSKTKTWHKVIEGLKILKREGVRCGFSYVLSRHTVTEIPEAIKIGRDLGVNFIHFLNVLPHAGVNDLNFIDSVIRQDSYEELALIEEYKKLEGSEIVEWGTIVPISDTPRYACMSPFIAMGVDGRGAVSNCRRIDAPTFAHKYDQSNSWLHPYKMSLLFSVTGDRDEHKTCQGCFGNWNG